MRCFLKCALMVSLTVGIHALAFAAFALSAVGEVSCAADESQDLSFYISNHDQSPIHRVVHPFVGKTNFVYDAQGALEKISGEAIAFLVKDCENVTIRNLRLDWERPCLTECRIIGFSRGKTIVEIDEKLFPVTVAKGRLRMIGPGWTNDVRSCKLFDGRSHEQLALSGDIVFDGSAEELGERRYAFKYDFSTCGVGAKRGDVVVLRPALRPNPAIVVYGSKNVVLEDVVVHDSYGMALIAQRSENVTWRGTKTAADKTSGVYPRAGCYASAHADASHFSNVKGQVTVENCWFEGMMDDAINVHSTCLSITNVVSANRIRCRYMHPQAVGFEVFRPGETLRLINGRTLEDGPTMTVTDVEVHDAREVTLSLADPLPPGWGVGDAVENADYQCAATFRGNVVCHNRARGSLFTTPLPVIVESNLFSKVTGAAILFSGDDYYWYESGACRNVVIRGNVFSNCLTSAGGYSRGVLSFYPVVRDVDAQRKCYHGNVLIEDNVFESFDAPLLFALSVENLTWRHNSVRRNALYRGFEQSPFVLRHCRNVTVDGVRMPDDTPMATVGRVEEAFDGGWTAETVPGGFRYARTFSLPSDAEGQCVFLDVEDLPDDSVVDLNGSRVCAESRSAYRVNLTPSVVQRGQANALSVFCRRPVEGGQVRAKLVRTAPIHVGYDGVKVAVKVLPDDSAEVAAHVDVRGPLPFIRNSWKNPLVWGGVVTVTNRVLGEDGLKIGRPKAGSYTLETVVVYEGRVSDRVLTQFEVLEAPVSDETLRAKGSHPELVAKVDRGVLKSARASWWGFDPEDSTVALQKAIDSKATRIVIDKMDSDWITEPLFISRDNLTLEFEDGAVIMAKKGAFLGRFDSLFTIRNANGIRMCGKGILRMRRDDYTKPPYARAEWRAGIATWNVHGLIVDGLRIEETGGDGMMVCLGSRDVVIRNVVCDRNFRQGISIISCSNLLIEQCEFINTQGTAPAAGVDFEPDAPNERIENCVMRNCVLRGNNGSGVDVCLNNLASNSVPVSLRIENCRLEDNTVGTVIRVSNHQNYVSGEVCFCQCDFVSNRYEGIGFEYKPARAAKVVFDRCRILDCGTRGGMADIRLAPPGWDIPLADGFEFRDLFMRQRMARAWLGCKDANFARRPTQITGTVIVEASDRTVTTNVIDAALLSKVFPKEADSPCPRVAFDHRAVKIVDTCPGVSVKLTDIAFQSEVEFLFHVARAGEVRFKARRVPPKDGMTVAPGQNAQIFGVDRDFRAQVLLPGSEPADMTFRVDAAGWYRMVLRTAYPYCFHLMESSCPIAVLTDHKRCKVLARAPSGCAKLWFDAPARKIPFSFVLRGDSGDNFVKTEVFDSAGRLLARSDAVSARWTVLPVSEGTRDGLSSVVFSRSPNHAFWYFSFDLTGLPSVLFLSPEKCWHQVF